MKKSCVPTTWLITSRTFHDAHGVASSSWAAVTLPRTERVEAIASSSG